MESPSCLYLLLLLALLTIAGGQTPPQVVQPGKTVSGILSSQSKALFEIPVKAPFPAGSQWIEIVATRPTVSDQCSRDSIAMFTSINLADVQTSNPAHVAFPYRSCSKNLAGQIDRHRLPSTASPLTIYVAVTAQSEGSYQLAVNYRAQDAGSAAFGKLTPKQANPWHVMIRRSSNANTMEPFCSGSLISPRWILTAARCLTNIGPQESIGRQFDVRLGAHATQGDDLQLVSFTANDVYVSSDETDIGLLRLPHPVSVSEAIAPISLPSADDQDWIQADFNVAATYWDLDSHATYPVDLHQFKSSVVLASRCSEIAQSLGLGVDDLATETPVLCAADTSTPSYCSGNGDLGSPLVGTRKGTPVLIGVLGSGQACRTNDNVAVYANVVSYAQLIDNALNTQSLSAYWYPGASRLPFDYSNGGSRTRGSYRGVLMTLETYSYIPSTVTYYGWRNPPHFTVHTTPATVKIYQHFPISVAARALMQGEPATTNVIEVALAWKSPEIDKLPTAAKQKLAELMRWIEGETGIKRTSRQFYKPLDAYGEESPQRMSQLEWKYFNGWCGRQHVPGVANPDPGMLDTTVLLSHNEPVHKYDVRVYTSDDSIRGPATIEISLAGQYEYTKTYLIASRSLTSGSFDAGSTAQFTISTNQNLGTINRIRIATLGVGNSWLLKRVELTTSNLKFSFSGGEWFDPNKGDKKISRVLSLDGPTPTRDQSKDAVKTVTVQDIAEGRADCSLSSVRGLTNQIFHQFHCDNVDALTDISSYSRLCMESTAVPYMQPDAAKSLKRLLDDEPSQSVLTVTSTIRSLPAQYLLTQWHKRGACDQINSAAAAAADLSGKSDDVEGLVIEVRQFDELNINASKNSFSWAGNSSENRFTFIGPRSSSVNIQQAMIKSFQTLWNLNNPSDSISVSGQWDDITSSRLAKSPPMGFPVGPPCSYSKPSIPCCRGGNERGRCTTTETCLGNSQCASFPNSEASLCSDGIFSTCCPLIQTKQPASEYFYEVLLYVGNQPDSISNADIRIRLGGTKGNSKNIVLQASGGYSAQPGSILRYNVSLPFDLGDVTRFDVGHSDDAFGSGFYLEKVSVVLKSSNGDKNFEFICNCWLDSSTGYIETTLQKKSTSSATNCSDAASLAGKVKIAVEKNPGCSLSEAYGLAQQIIDQVQCDDPSIFSDISNDINLCIQNQAFPYLSAAAHSSLRQNVNSSAAARPFAVLQGLNPFVYQFIQLKWSEKKMCGIEKAQKIGAGIFDQGNAVAVTKTDDLSKLLPQKVWKTSPTTKYLRFTPKGSDMVTAQVRAFQRLWNANEPKSAIPVDGMMSQKTVDALLQSPAGGFASGAQCRLPKKTGTPCCTADKKKGQCVATATCEPENKRQGYCSDSSTVCCIGRSSVEIEFPSGLTLSETLPPAAESSKYSDPLRRGIPLINGDGNKNRLVSTNFRLGDFFDSTSNYLRLSPLLVQCIQLAQDDSESTINVTAGYMTSETAKAKNSRSAHRAGSAVTIQLADNRPGTILAESVLRGCLSWLRSQGSDVGIGLLDQQTLQVELRDTFDAWTIPLSGITTVSFQSWARNKLTEMEKRLSQSPTCTGVSQLSIGETYPSTMSATVACGKIDQIIKRYSSEFEKLVQYSGKQIAFSSEEKDDTWCGWPGRKCIDCRTETKGYSPELKCADRLMTPRLTNRLALLHQIIAKELPGHTIIVSEAWDEPTSASAHAWGSFDAHSLHYEGRAADIAISKNLTATPNHPYPPPADDSLLPRLSALAVCAGFDHVWYKDKQRIQVSVKKARGVGNVVSFPYADFLCVSSPSMESDAYALEKSLLLVGDGCLLDSDGRQDDAMTKQHPLRDFLSKKELRYFRLHPLIPATLDLIEERLWADYKANVSIKKAYETSSALGRLHNLGQGIEIKTEKTSVVNLASTTIETAGHYLVSAGFGIGMELGVDSIYYDVRPRDLDTLQVHESSSVTLDQLKALTKLSFERALLRINAMGSDSETCDGIPSAPSSTYTWQSFPTAQDTARTYRCTEDEESTQHCQSTKKYRQEQVDILWDKIQIGHHFMRTKEDVKSALQKCFGDLCGKCYDDDVWSDKLEQCSNFVHWVPLDYGPKQNGALFATENLNSQETPCRNFACLEKTEVYSVLAPSIFSLYPVQEGKSTKDEIYSPNSNPLPVLEILQETFAMQLDGKATVVVEKATQLSSIKNSLKVLMAYNKKISDITILTAKSEVDAIRAFIESSRVEWSSSLCASQSRKYFANINIQTFDGEARK